MKVLSKFLDHKFGTKGFTTLEFKVICGITFKPLPSVLYKSINDEWIFYIVYNNINLENFQFENSHRKFHNKIGDLKIGWQLEEELGTWFNQTEKTNINYTQKVIDWFKTTYPDYEIPYNYVIESKQFQKNC